MYKLTKEKNGKSILFEWMLARQKVFKTIKVKLDTASVVTYLNFDKPFILYMDALDEGMGAILH